MASRLAALSVDTTHPAGQAAFWGSLLGREAVADGSAVVLPGDDTQVTLRFVADQAGATARPGARRLHLHLTASTDDDQRRLVETVLGLGGRHLDVGQRPEEGHVVLSDPGGDAFCVLGAGATFVAGCGPLGEVACDGHREVGLFWRDALGWPLVWDRDGETAIQSPAGGTKIAWGGDPVAAKHKRNVQRFNLVTEDVRREMARLLALGATRLGEVRVAESDVVELADPEGNEFGLEAG